MDDVLLRELTPSVIAIFCRRGADFAAAEDAVLDATRTDAARRRREDKVGDEPPTGPASSLDDTLAVYFLCAHPSLTPSLTPSSAVALTSRAVGGLTTRQIAG